MKRTIVMWAMLTALIVLPMAMFAEGSWENVVRPASTPPGSTAPAGQQPAQAATGGGQLTITNAGTAEISGIFIISQTTLFEYRSALYEAGDDGKIAAAGNGSPLATLRLPNPGEDWRSGYNPAQPAFTGSGNYLVFFYVDGIPVGHYRQAIVTFTNGSATVDFETMSQLSSGAG